MAISPNLRAEAYSGEITGKPITLEKPSSIMLPEHMAVTIRKTVIRGAYQCFITTLYSIPTLFENEQLSRIFALCSQSLARLSCQFLLV